MTEPLLLVGCGGHARSLIDLVESNGRWQLLGLIGLPEQVGDQILGHKVLGCDNDLPELRKHCKNALLAVGQIASPEPRKRIAAELRRLKYMCPFVVSPHAHISCYSQLGFGTTVGHGAIVNAGSSIGNYCIINSQSLIEHDVIVGDYCHISTGSLINGNVRIGDGSFIGSGAVIREGINLPPYTVIGAGKRVMGWPLREEL